MKILFAITLLSVIVLSSCNKDEDPNPDPAPTPSSNGIYLEKMIMSEGDDSYLKFTYNSDKKVEKFEQYNSDNTIGGPYAVITYVDGKYDSYNVYSQDTISSRGQIYYNTNGDMEKLEVFEDSGDISKLTSYYQYSYPSANVITSIIFKLEGDSLVETKKMEFIINDSNITSSKTYVDKGSGYELSAITEALYDNKPNPFLRIGQFFFNEMPYTTVNNITKSTTKDANGSIIDESDMTHEYYSNGLVSKTTYIYYGKSNYRKYRYIDL